MKYTTKKAEELKKELNALIQKRDDEIHHNNKLFYEYCKMEGMYGKEVSSPWDCGQGLRGYHYEYATEALRKKEEAERKQFLADNNYKGELEIYKEYSEKIAELENAFNLEQYGMTTEARKNAKARARLEKHIRELEEELANTRAELEKLNN